MPNLSLLFSDDDEQNKKQIDENSKTPSSSLNLAWEEKNIAEFSMNTLMHNTTITSLNLSGHSIIKQKDYLSLAQALLFNQTLASLTLNECAMDTNGILAIATAISKNPTLTWLDLKKTSINEEGIFALKKAMILREPNPLKRFNASKKENLSANTDFPSLKNLCIFSVNQTAEIKKELSHPLKVAEEIRQEAETADKMKRLNINF